MQKCYIQYAVTFKNHLIISCYHNSINAATAFVDLRKKYHDSNKLSPLKASVDIPFVEDDVGDVVIDQIKKIQSYLESQNPVIATVYFTGDVNLGFGGNSKFPPFLLNSSIHQLFRNHPLTNKVPVHISLESANEDIVKEAAGIHLALYAKKHELTYPDSPVTMKVKRATFPLYDSSTELKKSKILPGDEALTVDEEIKEISQPGAHVFFSQDLTGNKPEKIITDVDIVDKSVTIPTC